MRDDYRKGFADQTNEIIAPSLEVEGVIPEWLNGTLLRNGPARFRLEDKTLNHWFDGLAMLHKFDIAEGKVGYANKFLDSPAFRAAQDGKMQYGEFATDPCRSLFKRIAQVFTGSKPGPMPMSRSARSPDGSSFKPKPQCRLPSTEKPWRPSVLSAMATR